MNHISQNNFPSIEQLTGQLLNNKSKTEKRSAASENMSFQEILSSKQTDRVSEKLKFSKHANDRMNSRNIDLSKEQMQRLESGTNRARAKGIQESLVMVDDLAFIVNVKNNTVVTAVNDAEDVVFTNIDGAVIS